MKCISQNILLYMMIFGGTQYFFQAVDHGKQNTDLKYTKPIKPMTNSNSHNLSHLITLIITEKQIETQQT